MPVFGLQKKKISTNECTKVIPFRIRSTRSFVRAVQGQRCLAYYSCSSSEFCADGYPCRYRCVSLINLKIRGIRNACLVIA